MSGGLSDSLLSELDGERVSWISRCGYQFFIAQLLRVEFLGRRLKYLFELKLLFVLNFLLLLFVNVFFYFVESLLFEIVFGNHLGEINILIEFYLQIF